MSVCPMAYETQFFGFTPQTCMLRIYLAFQDYLFEVMVVVESVILKKLDALPHCRVSPVEIRKSTERFLHFMKERFDQLFGKMEEVLLQLVLSIPRHVLLPEDRAQALYPCSREQFCALQEEISVLQRRCRAEAGAGQALRAELQEQGKVRAELESILRWFDGLENVCRERGAGSFQESFAFLRQNSRKLQEVLRDIEEKSNKMKRCDPSLRGEC